MSPRPFPTVKKINDFESHSELIQRDLEVKKEKKKEKKLEPGNINNDRKSRAGQSGGLGEIPEQGEKKQARKKKHFVAPATSSSKSL